jgi:hypothetical protein
MCPPVDKDAGVLGRQWRVLDAGRKDNRSSTPVAGGHRSQGATEEGLSRRAREQQQQGGAGGRGYRSKFLLNKITVSFQNLSKQNKERVGVPVARGTGPNSF